MRLCVSAILLLVLARTWTGADPRPDHHGPTHGLEHGPTHGPEHGPTHGLEHGLTHGLEHGPAHGPEHGPAHGPDHGPSPESEDCSKFNSPLSLKDKTPVLGRLHFLVGFTDNPLYQTLLNLTSSFWFNVAEIQTGLGLTQYNKMMGKCIKSSANATISDDTAKVTMFNIISEFQFINSSRTSMILNIKASAPNVSRFIERLNLNPSDFNTNLRARSFYLMSRDSEVSEEDLQLFKEHAKCEGFTGEPDYIHNTTQTYCTEEESILTIF